MASKRVGLYEFGVVPPELYGEATDLISAIIRMRNAWREGRETYSVEMMCAVGEVITEAEKVIDFTEDEDGDDWGDPR